jgi:adenine C2-methylase RlmN of 23S rRNA A2503 and tRNA A37
MYNLHDTDLVKWLKEKTGALVATLICLETPDYLKLLPLCLSKIAGCGSGCSINITLG